MKRFSTTGYFFGSGHLFLFFSILVPAELKVEPAPPEYGYPTWIYFQGGPKGECSVGFGADEGYPAWHFDLKRKQWYLDS